MYILGVLPWTPSHSVDNCDLVFTSFVYSQGYPEVREWGLLRFFISVHTALDMCAAKEYIIVIQNHYEYLIIDEWDIWIHIQNQYECLKTGFSLKIFGKPSYYLIQLLPISSGSSEIKFILNIFD